MKLPSRKVILLLGEEHIETYFNVMCFDAGKLQAMMDSIDITEFDTEEEEEAFRLGICKINGRNSRDFCELTEDNYRKLKKRLRG